MSEKIIRQWLSSKLHTVLQMPCDDVAEYIMSTYGTQSKSQERDTYLVELLGKTPNTAALCKEIELKIQAETKTNRQKIITKKGSSEFWGTVENAELASNSKPSSQPKKPQKSSITEKSEKLKFKTSEKVDFWAPTVDKPSVKAKKQDIDFNKKVPPKFMTKKAGEKMDPCHCMGIRHASIINCTHCGKIICRKEWGSDDKSSVRGCSFCGSELRVDRKVLNVDNIGGDSLKAAIATKERLLLFDKTSASRTQVLDDQGDYFSNLDWLTPEERKDVANAEALRESNSNVRRPVVVSFDLMGRQIVQVEAENSKVQPESSFIGSRMSIEQDEVQENVLRDHSVKQDKNFVAAELSGKAQEVFKILCLNLAKEKEKSKSTKAVNVKNRNNSIIGNEKITATDSQSDDFRAHPPIRVQHELEGLSDDIEDEFQLLHIQSSNRICEKTSKSTDGSPRTLAAQGNKSRLEDSEHSKTPASEKGDNLGKRRGRGKKR